LSLIPLGIIGNSWLEGAVFQTSSHRRLKFERYIPVTLSKIFEATTDGPFFYLTSR